MSWSIPTSSHKPNNFSGKATFLKYYLARELARAQPTVYLRAGYFHIFTKEGVYLIKEEPIFGGGWKSTTCLVDGDIQYPPPDETMMHSVLFVLAAVSARPDDRYWVKQRPLSQEYVLNPPSRDTLVKVLVRSSVPSSYCSHSPVSLIGTCRMSPSLGLRELSQCMGTTCGP